MRGQKKDKKGNDDCKCELGLNGPLAEREIMSLNIYEHTLLYYVVHKFIY